MSKVELELAAVACGSVHRGCRAALPGDPGHDLPWPVRAAAAHGRAAAQTGDPRRAWFRSAYVRGLRFACGVSPPTSTLALTSSRCCHNAWWQPPTPACAGHLANPAIVEGTPDGAQRMLSWLGANYAALCADQSKPGSGKQANLLA